ncbi:hypothetical protein Cgig2_026655 [Carnegiea gigantea]|uniref:Fructose-2,6-bisphosphatase n=1 Tax=Carnegiea gigantea TaxID=171969 RepID=A0A9Q1JVP5_9CARY|nr:hypothetical protein Cgig2_026655 [Carnegiea gigantea]
MAYALNKCCGAYEANLVTASLKSKKIYEVTSYDLGTRHPSAARPLPQLVSNDIEEEVIIEFEFDIWTSTLQRSILTANHIVGFPKVQWRALDEINAGVCDGMTYEEIKKNMPEEYESRKKDKLRYRYPRGESYLDVIQRLEPVIIELERQRAPVVVISHQAVLRALYAYFAERPLEEIPHIEAQVKQKLEVPAEGAHIMVHGCELHF